MAFASRAIAPVIIRSAPIQVRSARPGRLLPKKNARQMTLRRRPAYYGGKMFPQRRLRDEEPGGGQYGALLRPVSRWRRDVAPKTATDSLSGKTPATAWQGLEPRCVASGSEEVEVIRDQFRLYVW